MFKILFVVKSCDYVYFLHSSEYKSCAVGIMVNNETGKQKKMCSGYNLLFFIPPLLVIGCPSGFMTILWASYYLVDQTEAKGWLKRLYPEHLTKRSYPQDSRTI